MLSFDPSFATVSSMTSLDVDVVISRLLSQLSLLGDSVLDPLQPDMFSLATLSFDEIALGTSALEFTTNSSPTNWSLCQWSLTILQSRLPVAEEVNFIIANYDA
jgi:hypothetical protein